VDLKPQAFAERGWIFVSVNYRLHPDADFREQAADLAAAVAWIRAHARDYGGDPQRLHLLGHSAGAHLAALLATDHRYLAAEKLQLRDLRGVVLLDGAGYDIARQIRTAARPVRRLYDTVFGDDPAVLAEASPITHVAADKGIPPFLILYVDDRATSKAQSESFAKTLSNAGVPAGAVGAENKTHRTINREFGKTGDEPTRRAFAFLEELARGGHPADR
jgi:acetyl esterase/lipase